MRRLAPTVRASAAAALLLLAPGVRAEAPTPFEAAVGALQSAFATAVAPGDQAEMYRELFSIVLQRVHRSYPGDFDFDALAASARKVLEDAGPGSADPRELFGKAMNAGLKHLDPYSRYLDARATTNERESWGGSFGGVGLEVAPGEGVVRVVASIPGTPAARAGLQSGDLIVRIDDQPMQGVPLADAIAKMRGAPGTAVAITVRRNGAEEFTLSLTRDTIRRQAVRWSMEDDVLVLQLSNFSGPVSGALRSAISEATAAHAPRAVLLDLRGNPGGLLREAVLTADLFLAAGEIVTVKGRTAGANRTWNADAEEVLPGLPMAVLIDRRSASAAELVAAALQDNGRATLLGQRSFGKGTVQTTFFLGEERRGALKLTSSFYHRPAGPTVQKTGVAPDIELAADTPPGAEADALAGPRSQARVDPGRCPALYKAADLPLACAVAYLHEASVAGFLTRVGQ